MTDDDPLALLHEPTENPHLWGGFGPLLAALVLVIAMLVFAPSVAPERVILEPDDTATTEISPP